MELDYPLLVLFHSRSVLACITITRVAIQLVGRMKGSIGHPGFNGTHALDDRRKLVSKIAEFYSEDLPVYSLFSSSYAMSSPRVEGFYRRTYPGLYIKLRLSGVR